MIPHTDYLLALSCPWCGAAFTYSWWRGGTRCKGCGKPTGKADLDRGNVNVAFYAPRPNIFDIGPVDEDGFIPQFRHVGWRFRCEVTSGQLMAFLKWGALLSHYNPMTVVSMETGPQPTRWHWNVHVRVPIDKHPIEMQGVTWNNEMTVRPQ